MVIALNYGIVGFFVYYTMFVIPVIMSGKFTLSGALWRDRELSLLMPVAVSLTNYIVIKSVFSNPDNHPMAFMMLGMALALIARVRKLAEDAPPQMQENVGLPGVRPAVGSPKRATVRVK